MSSLEHGTVEPPTVDSPRKGHYVLDLFIKDIAQGSKNYSPYSSNATSEKRTTSPQWTKHYIVPKVSFIQRFHCSALSALDSPDAVDSLSVTLNTKYCTT